MKSITAKKIVAVVAGAALLGAGLAFAGPVTFQSVPIISNSGQPVVQIVVGSNAKISDGVAAANIAAAIGNLAYTSTPITASINTSQALSVLHTSISSPKYSLSNQQVWLNESTSSVASSTGGTYVFSTLIGSVLNQGVQLGSPINTKVLQGGSTYAFTRNPSTTTSPLPSPYTASGYVPMSTTVTATNNGGGITFQGLTNSSDNLLEVSSAQLSSLKSNWGATGESEYLWLTGFPVYDQASGVNNFQLLDAAGAYQVVFGNPIQNRTSSNSIRINQPISFLGQDYTIINESGAGNVNAGTYTAGGKIYLASSLAPLQTVYIGKNLTSGPWTVQLQDLGQPNQTGISAASVSIFYNGILTNQTQVYPNKMAKFNVSGNQMFLNLNQTFAGLYSYQKWAKLEMYTNVWQVQNGKSLNQTTNPGWTADLLWTNTTGSGKGNALYSIVVYNSTPTSLSPGQSLSFVQDPSIYKLNFLGDTLGSGQYDKVSFQTSTASNLQYQNLAASTGGITNITEPAQELVVTSQIPNAFSYGGQTSSSVTYDLTPYELSYNGNAGSSVTGTNVSLSYTNPSQGTGTSAWIGPNYPFSVEVSGYPNSSPASTPITESVTFENTMGINANTISGTLPLNIPLYNVTSIQIQGDRALPINKNSALTINVINNAGTLSSLTSINSPEEIYSVNGKVYSGLSSSPVIYNQQNGQPTSTLNVQLASGTMAGGSSEYANFTIEETSVPGQSTPTDGLGVGLFNATSGVGATPLYLLNYSMSGSRNNVTYTSTSGTQMSVPAGFRTERGSKVISISPNQAVFDLAKAVDELQFSVGQPTSNIVMANGKYNIYGPYSVGEVTNIPNSSIAVVNASIKVSGSANTTINGVNNITATPSVTSALTPVRLNSLASTDPMVVLDNAVSNQQGSLILVGSGYVNTLSKLLEAQYNLTADTTPNGTPIVQAYGINRILVAGYTANQTTQAADNFISQLYSAASNS